MYEDEHHVYELKTTIVHDHCLSLLNRYGPEDVLGSDLADLLEGTTTREKLDPTSTMAKLLNDPGKELKRADKLCKSLKVTNISLAELLVMSRERMRKSKKSRMNKVGRKSVDEVLNKHTGLRGNKYGGTSAAPAAASKLSSNPAAVVAKSMNKDVKHRKDSFIKVPTASSAGAKAAPPVVSRPKNSKELLQVPQMRHQHQSSGGPAGSSRRHPPAVSSGRAGSSSHLHHHPQRRSKSTGSCSDKNFKSVKKEMDKNKYGSWYPRRRFLVPPMIKSWSPHCHDGPI